MISAFSVNSAPLLSKQKGNNCFYCNLAQGGSHTYVEAACQPADSGGFVTALEWREFRDDDPHSTSPHEFMRTETAGQVLVVCALSIAAVANGQATSTPPPPLDPFAAIRHVNLGGDGTVWVGFGGQLRERVESWTNFNFGALPPAPTTVRANDAFALTRALASADLHAGSHVRLFTQAMSSLSSNRELAGGRRPSDVDEIDVHQLYAELSTSKLGRNAGALTLRGGRLEMAYGRERLVSALDWANTKRSFDGITAGYGGPSGSVTAFWARPVVVRLYKPDRRDSTTALFGVYSTFRSAGMSTGADVYWIGQRRDSSAVVWNGTFGREMRHTVGLRLWGPTQGQPAVDLEGEAAVQFGDVGGNAIRASMFAGQAGYTFRRTKLAPRAYVNLDYASGDASPGGKVGTFSQLNPQPHPFLGFADIAGRQNIIDVSGGGSTQLWRTLVGAADYHSFRRASAKDAFYGLPGLVSRPAGFGTSKGVASEVDLSFRWPVDQHELLLTGWSHVFPGTFIREGGSASSADKPIDFVYLMAQYTL